MNRVVVGIRGTEQVHSALEWALRFAGDSNLAVELVHVVEVEWRTSPAWFAEQVLLAAEENLREHAESARARYPDVRLHSQTLVGNPTHTLIELAGSGLLVLGTHALERFGKRIFSTRAARIAARSEGQVILIPDGSDQAGTGIVVGIDGSEESVAALGFAAREADRVGEKLTAVHAWSAPRAWTDEPIALPASQEEEEHRVLAEALAGVREDHPDLEIVSEVPFQRAAEALYAASVGARMLVVGSHGSSGLERAWLGSTSEELLLAMPCAVAVVRAVGKTTAQV